MIDKLTVYYGLAIRRHCNSIEEMRKAIWATYDHYSSTDANPKHDKCPSGITSCTPGWQRAFANGELDSFKHDYNALPANVLEAIKPIYENLSCDTLLKRCVGGFTQNNNESFNQLIWKISPKIYHSGSHGVEFAAYVATCIFNEGTVSLLKILQEMEVNCGPNAHLYAAKKDEERIRKADVRTQESTREARLSRKQAQIDVLEAVSDAEGLLYGPGIDDSM